MESIEARLDKIEYHNRLLARMYEEEGKYPFYTLVIEHGLTEEEVKGVFSLCEEIQQKMHEQMEEGLLSRTSLLTHFVGMLDMKLKPIPTIKAIQTQEEKYENLMTELLSASPNYQ
ncbi:DUF1878 family protein [Alkalihalobacillus sp. CinArs1]|uniref:DUF1878 family protein n=1 Tax=Alkalihalobacillus sp. CinArs1 TaxID=2995314 RepID=UPI0022DD310F|nr:DUF1878 family protein [Alkalihalobacillus sp. CinArs1]